MVNSRTLNFDRGHWDKIYFTLTGPQKISLASILSKNKSIEVDLSRYGIGH